MTLFGTTLSEIESRMFENLKRTKAVFPEETQRIEWGLALMRNLTQITVETSKEYQRKPNLFANHNLFARNRQLLLNAYSCLLFSSYGTQFVILRTVLENNNLMRLFNINPQYAYEWLSRNVQKQLSEEAQLKYGKSGKHDVTYKASKVRRLVFEGIEKENLRSDINTVYKQLCNYTHPNFYGWRELIVQNGNVEVILNMPFFMTGISETAIGLNLYLMQLSFKTFVETFREYLAGFAHPLQEWQNNYNKIMLKYKEQQVKKS
jgi:hypothetical protein